MKSCELDLALPCLAKTELLVNKTTFIFFLMLGEMYDKCRPGSQTKLYFYDIFLKII